MSVSVNAQTSHQRCHRADHPQHLGVGIVGLGMAAAPHAKALSELSGQITVRGAFARDGGARRSFCQKYGFVEATSMDSILSDREVGAILLLTPPNARLDIVKACADAGKHILMEKPIERTVAAAEQIVAICEAAGVGLGIVFQHRFRPGSRRLRQLLQSGDLGDIAMVRVQVPWWRDQSYYDEPGRGTKARDGGGVLISQAIHSLDLMLALAGPVSEVQALSGTTRLHDMGSEDFVAGGLRFANGAVGAVMATTAAFPGEAETIDIDCENGSARLQSGALRLRWRDGRVDQTESDLDTGAGADPMAFPHDWHRDLIAEFAHAVSAGRAPQVTGREALNVHYLIDALLTSARTGSAAAVAHAPISTTAKE